MADPQDDFDSAAETEEEPVAPLPARPRLILLSPWQQDLDLNTKQGKALWDEGIKPLEAKFSGKGQDLPEFLSLFRDRARKCFWMDVLTFGGLNLIDNYGRITLPQVIQAANQRRTVMPSTLAEARPSINSLMMYYFLKESLESAPRKKLINKDGLINQDGPTLLKLVLDDTFVATQASTFNTKEKLYNMHPKNYKWNVQLLNQSVREIKLDLTAAGHEPDDTDMIINIFRAYGYFTNEDFISATSYWKNEWNSGVLQTSEELMQKADAKYDELKSLGTWSKKSAKDDQIVALTAKIKDLTKSKVNNQAKLQGSTNNKKYVTPSWKYDRTLSKTSILEKNNKVFKWCEGPGHGNKGMWVRGHEPGKCSANYSKPSNSMSKLDKTALTSIIKSSSDLYSLSDFEIESKVEAMLAIMSS